MDRINHVKIVSPDPRAIEVFLTEVLEIPAGWPLGQLGPSPETPVISPARDANGQFTGQSVSDFRGASGQGLSGGLIVGDVGSRQFQVLQGPKAHIWATAVGTRNIERANERCKERGIPCTDVEKTPWGEGALEFFFAEVGGIVFEVLRAVSA
jgi:hypothetical protein